MNFRRYITGLFIVPFLCGCSDFLNIKDESAINPDIWNSEASATLYVNKIYSMCAPAFGGDRIYSSSASCSDEADGTNDLLLGTLESGSVGTYSAAGYQAIRYVNIALEEMKSSSLTGESRNNILGQLYFFRAWQHWRMVLVYGGIPYMKSIVNNTSTSEERNRPRTKTSQCMAYIKEDLTQAVELLPSTWSSSEWGRVTNAAAAALLGRVLLFYASPQFTPDQNSTEAKDRWQEAYQANLNAQKVCEKGGYGLLDCTTAVTKEWPARADINLIFQKDGPENREALFVRVYDDNNATHSYEQSTRPEAQTNSTGASNLPTLYLMRAFPMADGTAYAKEDNDMTYWENRDSRFYSTIVYNGCYLPYSDDSGYRQWTYSKAYSGVTKCSESGFYCRKMLNPSTKTFSKTATNWIEIRYAEVLLNLAEAALEVGEEEVMYACLEQLRKRAGTPKGVNDYGLKNTPYTPIELVMNERLIELAFEGKRFFDLRRRNMFTEELGPNMPKLNGIKKMAWRLTFSLNNSAQAAEFMEKRNQLSMEELSQWMKVTKSRVSATAKAMNYKCSPNSASLSQEKAGSYNFFDIPNNFLLKSPALKQTMGWTDAVDAFNPFE